MTTVHPSPRFSINYLCKYPFLNSAKEWIKDKDISPIDAFYNHVRILDRIRELFSDALENNETTNALRFDDPEVLYLYPLLRIILSFINTPRVTYKVANLISKHFGDLLSKDDDITVLLVGLDQGIRVKPLDEESKLVIGSVTFNYRIHFLNFLKVATKFKSPSWKLVNRLVKPPRTKSCKSLRHSPTSLLSRPLFSKTRRRSMKKSQRSRKRSVSRAFSPAASEVREPPSNHCHEPHFLFRTYCRHQLWI